MTIRIGEGWDVHALVAGRKLIIGGVEIPHSVGLLGDIGKHFPDTSADFKDADSWLLLQRTGELIANKGYRIGNIDSTVIAQAPKLAPYIDAMRARIAAALSMDVADVNVKAKTAEKMGPVGEGKSMEARAVVLIASAS